jgi:aspartate-semialdehyde dehydrogenase
MKVAVVGATGLVGTEMLKVLEQRKFPVTELIPVATARSVGKKIAFAGHEFTVVSAEEALQQRPNIALFSAGGDTSKELAPKFAEVGTTVIDNSSAWRMDPGKKLIVPEINAYTLTSADKIIANPNCSTIQLVLALGPLHKRYSLNRVIVSTYQSVTGSGKKGVDQLEREQRGEDVPSNERAYAHPIHRNALPHIDIFYDNGYTKEELKMVNETRKILDEDKLAVTATCVRIPTVGGHSESVNIALEKPFDIDEVRELLSKAPGLELQDDPASNLYPMPLHAHGKDATFVGRIRRDESLPNALNLWIVSDNLRKGAALNAVQIAEYLVEHELLEMED